jgi:acetyl-CoA carboxylase biotin carboxyl carrier protein
VDIKEIKAVLDLCKKQDVAEFELETKDFKIKLKRGNEPSGSVNYQESVSAPASIAAAAATPVAPPAPVDTGAEIKSPMIGTFYRAPSPESANYIEVGQKVDPETVVCLIEAMKVMNEIKAEVSGVITEVLVENAKPVEFDQPMFRIQPL